MEENIPLSSLWVKEPLPHTGESHRGEQGRDGSHTEQSSEIHENLCGIPANQGPPLGEVTFASHTVLVPVRPVQSRRQHSN